MVAVVAAWSVVISAVVFEVGRIAIGDEDGKGGKGVVWTFEDTEHGEQQRHWRARNDRQTASQEKKRETKWEEEEEARGEDAAKKRPRRRPRRRREEYGIERDWRAGGGGGGRNCGGCGVGVGVGGEEEGQ